MILIETKNRLITATQTNTSKDGLRFPISKKRSRKLTCRNKTFKIDYSNTMHDLENPWSLVRVQPSPPFFLWRGSSVGRAGSKYQSVDLNNIKID